MGVLYDKLYRAEKLEALQVSDYLPQLVNEVARTFGAAGRVRVETELGDFTLETNVLSQIGIAVNELVANAMKHGLSTAEEGVVRVTAACEGRTVTVGVEDSGPGFPDGASPDQSGSFGLTMVGAVAEQLEGSVRFEHSPELGGARVVLTFPFQDSAE
jgi:two-component sensor histidine kinase